MPMWLWANRLGQPINEHVVSNSKEKWGKKDSLFINYLRLQLQWNLIGKLNKIMTINENKNEDFCRQIPKRKQTIIASEWAEQSITSLKTAFKWRCLTSAVRIIRINMIWHHILILSCTQKRVGDSFVMCLAYFVNIVVHW